MPVQTLFIINPSSGGRGGRRKAAALQRALKPQPISCRWEVSRSESHLREMAVQAFSRYQCLVAVGGDTSFAIMVNAILDSLPGNSPGEIKRALERKAFGMLGTGSANDLSRELKTPSLDPMIRGIREQRFPRMDIGCLQTSGRPVYFLGSVSLGLGAEISAGLEVFKKRHPRLRNQGWWTYRVMPVGILLQAFRKGRIPLNCRLENGTAGQSMKPVFLVIQNSGTYAGGLTFSRESGLFSRSLSMLSVERRGLFSTLALVPAALRGKLSQQRGVRAIQGSGFTLAFDNPVAAQYDGEMIPPSRVLRLSILPGILPVIQGVGDGNR